MDAYGAGVPPGGGNAVIAGRGTESLNKQGGNVADGWGTGDVVKENLISGRFLGTL